MLFILFGNNYLGAVAADCPHSTRMYCKKWKVIMVQFSPNKIITAVSFGFGLH